MHRLETLVNVAAVEEIDERAGDHGLVVRTHGEVGIFPLAEDAEALEIGALEVDILLGVLAAGAADFDRRQCAPSSIRSSLSTLISMGNPALAIPPRNVGRIEAGHGARFDDEILQDLIERSAKE